MTKILKVIGLVLILNIIPFICLSQATELYDKQNVIIFSPSNDEVIVNSPTLISGTVSTPLAKVNINGTSVVVAENGDFEGSADLIDGKNNITVQAIEDKKIICKTISVIYKPM